MLVTFQISLTYQRYCLETQTRKRTINYKHCPLQAVSCVACLQVLIAIPDQDTFYDVTDTLEEQGMERVIQQHMNRKGADLDLLEQFQLYESMLRQEDGEGEGVSPTGTRYCPHRPL